MPETLKSYGINVFGKTEKALIAVDILWRKTGDLVAHRLRISGAIECLAVIEPDTIEWRQRPQFNVVGQFSAAEAPEVLKKKWCGDDRRARIKREAVLVEHACSASGAVKFLKDGTFLFFSQRTGNKHLYRYAADGQLKNAVTSGDWDAQNFIKDKEVDEKASLEDVGNWP